MVERENRINDKIKEFCRLISSVYSVKKLLLFGSYANGKYSKDSDIDIAVIIDEKDVRKRIEITANMFKIAALVDYSIEPKCIYWEEYLNHEPASIIGEIVRTGKAIA